MGALAAGIEETAFPDRRGSQVILVPASMERGISARHSMQQPQPAASMRSVRLIVSSIRLALMWDERHDQVLLGWDTKCPFMREEIPGRFSVMPIE